MIPPTGQTATGNSVTFSISRAPLRSLAAFLVVMGALSEAHALEPSASGAAATSATKTPAASGAAATSATKTPAASGAGATSATKKPAASGASATSSGRAPGTSGSAGQPVAVVQPKTPTERQAAQLSREALGVDFNAGHFLVSEGKLREAIRICGPEVCTTAYQSRLHRDLGYLYVAGLARYDDGRDEFTVALGLDPSVALTPGMQTPEALQTFGEAKSGTAGSKGKYSKAEPEGTKAPVQAQPSLQPEPTPATQPESPPPAAPDKELADSPPIVDDSAHWDLVRNWVTLSIQQDLVFHSKTPNACSQGSPYRCFDATGAQNVLTKDDFVPGGNQISGSGALPGTLRLLLGFDHVVHPHISVGARLGSVISGKAKTIQGEQTFLYFHGEARVSVWMGRNVFSRSGLRPYIFLSAGLGEADGKILVDYAVDGSANTYKLDAWKRSGHTFVSPGLGLQAAFSKRGGPIAEFRYMQFMSPNVPVLGLQLGYSIGF